MKQQAKHDQAHRELRCLYLLKPSVLPQDTALFCATVEKHLEDSIPKICTWIIHNKKLITHSARIANAQTRLRIKQLKSFFPVQTKKKSTIIPRTTSEPRRHRVTRLATHFQSSRILRSTSRSKSTSARVTLSQSQLPTINEDEPSQTNTTEWRRLQRRCLNDDALFPDHPG